jgi:hypothetical protein
MSKSGLEDFNGTIQYNSLHLHHMLGDGCINERALLSPRVCDTQAFEN